MISSGPSAGPYYQVDGAPSGSASTGAAGCNSTSTVAATSTTASGSYSRTSSLTSSFPPIAPAPAPMPMAPQHMMHPAPLLPYPHHQPPHMHMPNGPGAQGQIICSGCRTLLVYPNNASNVRCALCTTVTPVPPAGTEMAQLVCGGCRTLLMYVRGASSVQCSCCHTVNLAMDSSQIAHINCGGCGMTLMYSYGAPSVKCAVCQFISNVSAGPNRMPLPMQRPPYAVNQSHSQSQPAQIQNGRTQTVVVENPMTLDENGKLVNSVAVGVTADAKN